MASETMETTAQELDRLRRERAGLRRDLDAVEALLPEDLRGTYLPKAVARLRRQVDDLAGKEQRQRELLQQIGLLLPLPVSDAKELPEAVRALVREREEARAVLTEIRRHLHTLPYRELDGMHLDSAVGRAIELLLGMVNEERSEAHKALSAMREELRQAGSALENEEFDASRMTQIALEAQTERDRLRAQIPTDVDARLVAGLVDVAGELEPAERYRALRAAAGVRMLQAGEER